MERTAIKKDREKGVKQEYGFALRMKKAFQKESDDLSADYFVILVFENPKQKYAWAKKFMGDEEVVYAEGQFFSAKEHDEPVI